MAKRNHSDRQSESESKYVALVSGLNYGKENADFDLERTRMMEFLNGSLHVLKLFIAYKLFFSLNLVEKLLSSLSSETPCRLLLNYQMNLRRNMVMK